MREMGRTDFLPYRAVIVDFDRTLLRTDKSISAFTAGTLLDLKRSGVRLFAATARPERAITEYCERIPFDAVTTLNGARTITQDGVFDHPIRRDSAESILEQLHRAEGTVISVEAEDGPYANTDIPIWSPTVMADLRKLPGEKKIYKILPSHPTIPADGIRINLPDDTYSSVAERKLLQIMSGSATKWNGVLKMLESFGIGADRAIYFGDDNDDLEPIRRCGCGVAVSNALECVRDAADYITESNDEDGVAKFLTGLVQSI
jgi:Cof subfamily protein (haloacid dehalogenase superfamily)